MLSVGKENGWVHDVLTDYRTMSVACPSNADEIVGMDAVTAAPSAENNVNARSSEPDPTATSNTNSLTDLAVVRELVIGVGIEVETVSDGSWSEHRGYLRD